MIPARAPPGSAVPRRAILAVECAALFVAVPLLIAGFRAGGPVLPFLWIAAPACWLALRRDPSFDRGSLWRTAEIPRFRGVLTLRLAAAGVGLFALAWVLDPAQWMALPRHRPVLWALVVVLYPVLSVYPQEIVYRAFFMHRYRGLFGDGPRMLAVSAAAFSLAHVVFGSPWALALTAGAGWALGVTWQRTKSLAVCCLEHAVYGAMVFTAGLGPHFYAATEKTVRMLAPGAP